MLNLILLIAHAADKFRFGKEFNWLMQCGEPTKIIALMAAALVRAYQDGLKQARIQKKKLPGWLLIWYGKEERNLSRKTKNDFTVGFKYPYKLSTITIIVQS